MILKLEDWASHKGTKRGARELNRLARSPETAAEGVFLHDIRLFSFDWTPITTADLERHTKLRTSFVSFVPLCEATKPLPLLG